MEKITMSAKSKTNQAAPPDEPYTNIEMRLVCASKIRVRNGEHAGKVIDWDASMLRVYLYLFNQVKGFESKDGMFYQSQKKIWLSTNIGKTKLNEVLSALKILGLITDTGETVKVKGAPRGLVKLTASRLIDVIGNLEIDFADYDGKPVWDHERASGKKKGKKHKNKQDDGKFEPQPDPQVETAEQSSGLTVVSTAPIVGQQSDVGSNSGSGNDVDACDDNLVSKAQSQSDETDAPFPLKKTATVGQVIASLDDLRHWANGGESEGLEEYGTEWNVSGDDLYKLIDEHSKIREEEAMKDFKSQGGH